VPRRLTGIEVDRMVETRLLASTKDAATNTHSEGCLNSYSFAPAQYIR